MPTSSSSGGRVCSPDDQGPPPCTDKCGCTDPNTSSSPVQYSTGTIEMTEADVDAGVPNFRHARILRNVVSSLQNYDGPNGYNWDIAEWPYLVSRSSTTINIRIGMNQLRADYDRDDDRYTIRHGQKDYYSFVHSKATRQFYLTHKSPDGSIESIIFTDFDQTINPSGLFYKGVDSSGAVTQVTSYTSDGNIAGLVRILNGVVFQLNYEYISSGYNQGRLEYVTMNQLDQYPDPTTTTPLKRSRYIYYVGTTTSHGNSNDLKAAIEQKLDSAGVWQDTAVTYYRYYKADSAIGYQHGLQYVVNPATYAELVAAGQDPLDDAYSGTDLVPSYADHYFEYSSNHRVTKEISRGCAACGSSGGTSDTGETFARSNNPNYPDSSSASSEYLYNTWKTKTVVQNTGDYQTIIYANRTNQVILKVIQDLNSSSNNLWCTYYRYDDQGRLVLKASPAAVTGYDESQDDLVGLQSSGSYIYLRDNDGLIELTTYYSATTATSTNAGGVEGWQKYTKIKQGVQGTEILQSYTTYIASSNTTDAVAYVPAAVSTYPEDSNQSTTAQTTTYSYLWYDPSDNASVRMKQRITTYPAIPTSQHGTGIATSIQEYFDENGNLIWKMDQRGIVTHHEYELARNLVVRTTVDVDNTVSTPPGWSVTSGSHFAYVTDYEYDDLGRKVLKLGSSHTAVIDGAAQTIRTATYYAYVTSLVSAQSLGSAPVGDQVRAGTGYVTGSSGSYSYYLVDPVNIQFNDKLNRTLDAVVSARSTGSGRLSSSDTFLRTDWSRWSVMSYTKKGQLEYQRDYHLIPQQSPDLGLDGINQTPGVAGTHYYETYYGYDDQTNQRVRVKAPTGTITRTVFDSINRPIAVYVGTNDVPTGGTWEDWLPGAAGTNLVLVSQSEYDEGYAGGNSNLTLATAVVDDSTLRQTQYVYDFRNRRTVADGEETYYTVNTYDNINRIVRVDQYNTSATGHLIARNDTLFDNLGRVYSARQYAVDPSTGTVGTALVGNNTYDACGNLIKFIAAGDGIKATYTSYDNIGRVTTTSIGYDDSSATNGRVIGETSSNTYDAAGNVLTVASAQLNTGSSITSQTYRTSYQAAWFDGINRPIATCQYGALDSFTRPDTVPARSDTELVTTTSYGADGQVFSTVDPMAYETRNSYDNLGRKTQTVENYTGTGTPATPDADDNRTTAITYTAAGQVATLTAVMASSSDNQVTTYIYGTTLADGSDIISNDLLQEVIYPDGTQGSDSVRLSYNRQGQIIKRIDQAGTTHEYLYDGLGRLRHDLVSAFGTNIDTTVQRLTTEYEVRGMPSVLSSCMTATPNGTASGGGLINQVAFAYNDFGQLINDVQSHDGTLVSTDPTVIYSYADGGDNSVRLTGITYPNSRQLTLEYDDRLPGFERVRRVYDSTIIEDPAVVYDYLGLVTQVMRIYYTIDTQLDLWGNTVGSYTGLDRFNRIIDQNWEYDLATPFCRYTYGYDRNSNRLYRADKIAQSLSKNFDELYTYDGLNRLTDMQRGLLNSTNTAIQSGTGNFEQAWDLDPVGNWKNFNQASTTTGTFDLVQAHSNNKVNEITGITETTGPSWVSPSYDPAGNTTAFPQVADPTQEYQGTYDAWNRLIKVMNGSTRVAAYVYDARHCRIRRREYDSAGAYVKTLDDFWSNKWQLIEVHSTTDDNIIGTQVVEQYVWGQSASSYVDELILRDRDANNDGALEERLFAMQDANYNVAAITAGNSQGEVSERYVYSPYGYRTVMDGSYNVIASSAYDWHIAHQGLYQDVGTNLIYNRYRMLHTQLGRFLQRDPLGYGDGFNLYEYVTSNPLIFIDSTGLIANVTACQNECDSLWSWNKTVLEACYICCTGVDQMNPEQKSCGPTFDDCITGVKAGKKVGEILNTETTLKEANKSFWQKLKDMFTKKAGEELGKEAGRKIGEKVGGKIGETTIGGNGGREIGKKVGGDYGAAAGSKVGGEAAKEISK